MSPGTLLSPPQGVPRMAPSPFPATPWENSSSNSSQAPQKSGMGQGTEQDLHPIGMGTTQQGQVPQHMLAPWWLQGPPCVWGHLGVPKATGTGSGCGQGLATPAPGWTSRLHHRGSGMLALLATSTLTAQPRRGCSRCPGVSPSRPHVLEGRGSGPGLRGRELGSAARFGDEVSASERGGEELCTSGFLTLAFNVPPQPDGKNK